MSRSSFTLIELLVVIAILAILAVAVVLVINPIDLMRQSRDSTRLTDLNSINKALALFDVTNPDDFTGTSTNIYTSLPASSEGACPGMTAPAGYTYYCVTSSTLTKIDGTGWIPANLSNISYGSPIGKLPIDPVNSSTTGQYYTYIMGGSWALSARIESEKYYYSKAFNDNGYDPDRMEIGSNLSLYQPVTNLVGHYFAQPGSGTTALDYSGNGYNGTITAGTGSWTTDQNGESNLAYDFDGTTSTIIINPTDSLRPLTHDFSVSFWFKTSDSDGLVISDRVIGGGVTAGFSIYISGSKLRGFMELGTGSNYRIKTTDAAVNDNSWHMGTITWGFSGNLITFYIDGVAASTTNLSGGTVTNIQSTSSIAIAKYNDGTAPLDGILSDLRVYNRVLSAAEILAIYNATR